MGKVICSAVVDNPDKARELCDAVLALGETPSDLGNGVIAVKCDRHREVANELICLFETYTRHSIEFKSS